MFACLQVYPPVQLNSFLRDKFRSTLAIPERTIPREFLSHAGRVGIGKSWQYWLRFYNNLAEDLFYAGSHRFDVCSREYLNRYGMVLKTRFSTGAYGALRMFKKRGFDDDVPNPSKDRIYFKYIVEKVEVPKTIAGYAKLRAHDSHIFNGEVASDDDSSEEGDPSGERRFEYVVEPFIYSLYSREIRIFGHLSGMTQTSIAFMSKDGHYNSRHGWFNDENVNQFCCSPDHTMGASESKELHMRLKHFPSEVMAEFVKVSQHLEFCRAKTDTQVRWDCFLLRNKRIRPPPNARESSRPAYHDVEIGSDTDSDTETTSAQKAQRRWSKSAALGKGDPPPSPHITRSKTKLKKDDSVARKRPLFDPPSEEEEKVSVSGESQDGEQVSGEESGDGENQDAEDKEEDAAEISENDNDVNGEDVRDDYFPGKDNEDDAPSESRKSKNKLPIDDDTYVYIPILSKMSLPPAAEMCICSVHEDHPLITWSVDHLVKYVLSHYHKDYPV